MSTDARFEDGAAARPLRLRAWDAQDLQVLAALVQDAVFAGSGMRWQPRRRRFAVLVNRFRWEAGAARPERVQALLAVEDVVAVRSQGIERDAAAIYSLLELGWQPGADGSGELLLTLAGGGAIALSCEALEVTLRDVTRPYGARSGRIPHHPD